MRLQIVSGNKFNNPFGIFTKVNVTLQSKISADRLDIISISVFLLRTKMIAATMEPNVKIPI